MTLSVKQATIDNVNEIAELFNQYRVFYQKDSDLPLALSFIAQRIQNNQSVIFYAENEQGEMLGFTQLYPTFSSVSVKSSFVLNDLYVKQSARRLGAAKKLMCAAKAHAQQSGSNGLALATATNNTNAQALYESLGYKKDNDYYHYFLSLD